MVSIGSYVVVIAGIAVAIIIALLLLANRRK